MLITYPPIGCNANTPPYFYPIRRVRTSMRIGLYRKFNSKDEDVFYLRIWGLCGGRAQPFQHGCLSQEEADSLLSSCSYHSRETPS